MNMVKQKKKKITDKCSRLVQMFVAIVLYVHCSNIATKSAVRRVTGTIRF